MSLSSRWSPLTQRRWAQFRGNRRAWWSLLSLLAVFAVTLAAELIANDKPLLVRYQHEWIVPLLEDVPETHFGGAFDTTTVYRDPAVQALIAKQGWMLWPMIRFNADTIHFERAEPTPSAPSRDNWLGTDDQGRDVLVRLLYGGQVSMAVGVIATALMAVLGITIGVTAGFVGGRVDACVPKSTRGCFPPRTGCGCAAESSARNALNLPVWIRVSHESRASSSAGTSFSRWRPVLAEMFTRGAQSTCARSCSISRSR